MTTSLAPSPEHLHPYLRQFLRITTVEKWNVRARINELGDNT